MRGLLSILSLGTALAVLSGCMPQPTIIELREEFNPSEAAFIHDKGNNTIKGQAFINQAGGGSVNCGGRGVLLVPETQYSRERIFSLYGSVDSGYFPNYKSARLRAPNNLEYSASMRKTDCDGQGNYIFENVADGGYFVMSYITWGVQTVEGGTIMRRVSVSGGVTKTAILTP